MFTLPPEVDSQLKAMSATYRIIHRQGTPVAQVVCTMSGYPYAEAAGPDEQNAVIAAVEKAKKAPKPISENEQLRKQLAQREKELEDLKAKPQKTKP